MGRGCLLAGPRADELHDGAALVGGEGVVHGRELGGVDLHGRLPMLGLRLPCSARRSGQGQGRWRQGMGPWVRPMVAQGGWLKTTVAMFSYKRRDSDSPLKRR